MKLKKWLYGLGGVAVVATPAIAVVGCSCSCSSKPSLAQPEATYKYDAQTKTGTYAINGNKYEIIKTALGSITSQATRAHVESLIFANDSQLVHLSPAAEIKSQVLVEHSKAPKSIPEITSAEIVDTGTSIELRATFNEITGFNMSATKDLLKRIAEGLYKGDEYHGAETTQGWAELNMVWSKIVEAIHIAI